MDYWVYSPLSSFGRDWIFFSSSPVVFTSRRSNSLLVKSCSSVKISAIRYWIWFLSAPFTVLDCPQLSVTFPPNSHSQFPSDFIHFLAFWAENYQISSCWVLQVLLFGIVFWNALARKIRWNRVWSSGIWGCRLLFLIWVFKTSSAKIPQTLS